MDVNGSGRAGRERGPWRDALLRAEHGFPLYYHTLSQHGNERLD